MGLHSAAYSLPADAPALTTQEQCDGERIAGEFPIGCLLPLGRIGRFHEVAGLAILKMQEAAMRHDLWAFEELNRELKTITESNLIRITAIRTFLLAHKNRDTRVRS